MSEFPGGSDSAGVWRRTAQGLYAVSRRLPYVSPSARVLFGLLLGILCGVFFGEYCAWLNLVGEGFIRLLQMTVLPYIMLSLVCDLASLSRERAGKLAGVVGVVAALFWGIGLLLIAVMPLSFPSWQRGFFFRPGLTENGEPLDVLSLFIPENIFRSLADDVVPAVVLFSACVGLAVMRIPGKMSLLQNLRLLKQGLVQVNTAIVRLTPIGVFAISANAAGTLRIDEVLKLPVYMQVYGLMVVLLAFWIIPLFVACLTPFSYREVVGAVRAAMVTAFATGKVLVVLPQIIASTEELFEKRFGALPQDQPQTDWGERVGDEGNRVGDEGNASRVDGTASVIVSLIYPFPHLGRLASLLFVPFTAWYVGQSMEAYEYPMFLVAGFVSYFGSPLVAMPALLDLQHLPADMMQLFVVSGVIASRLGDMLGTMHLFAVSLLSISALNGRLTISVQHLLRFGVILVFSSALVIGVNRSIAETFLQNVPPPAVRIDELQLLQPHSATEVHRQRPTELAERSGGPSRLDVVLNSGVLRIGYLPNNLPFSFFNESGQLVGFDIEMAQVLARELNCRLEFIPFTYETLAEQLSRGEIDVAMSGLSITTGDLARMAFSHPYLEVTFAVVVPDHERQEFRTRESVQAHKSLRIAVASSEFFRDEILTYVPFADVVVIESPEVYFEKPDEFDALVIAAEAGAAWTIVHPDFEVVVPQPNRGKHPLAYAIPGSDPKLESFLSHWVELKKGGLEFQQAYNHWILGQTPGDLRPRWSVIRDVLHWVE